MHVSTDYKRNGLLDNLNSLIKKFYSAVLIWHRNYRTRQQLSELPEHLYKDVGLTKDQVNQELNRHFWN
ncbi:DUF1127 domain-containing protein [Vibrio marisflavi]|uniref:YjiS-like domain-containing protein n=1 Tax=Vibrio marisflavi CECT 7928 TaxID=634439 RepID=A0ABN8E6D0_9VIBR|nr:DUF1127 domain-containing protein [Vibrio marisflavi]CAH0541218.1 hypothetical protein VMF7928_03454 [Vibrio marisflavi CECT 7928]